MYGSVAEHTKETMDDLEQAVLVLFNQSPTISAEVRAQANAYCDALQNKIDGSWPQKSLPLLLFSLRRH